MRNILLTATGLMAVGLVLSAAPARAGTLPDTGVCPNVQGHAPVGGGSTGVATDCNLLIVFGANGAITTYGGPQTTYDGVEDALIGVINNSGHALSSFNISGTGIFHFDGGTTSDGIDGYANITVNAQDKANPVNGEVGYGGPLGYFTSVSSTINGATNSGTVNFSTALTSGSGMQTGDYTYFSLEQPININQLPTITSSTAVPEPGTLAVLGTALFGLAGAIRRRSIG